MSASEGVPNGTSLPTERPVGRDPRPALLADAVKRYASLSDPYGDEALAGLAVTTTEACTAATALLRAQGLTPFEFAVWFSSSGR